MAVLRYTVYETVEPSEYSTAFADRAILPSIYYVDKYDISLHTPEPIKQLNSISNLADECNNKHSHCPNDA